MYLCVVIILNGVVKHSTTEIITGAFGCKRAKGFLHFNQNDAGA